VWGFNSLWILKRSLTGLSTYRTCDGLTIWNSYYVHDLPLLMELFKLWSMSHTYSLILPLAWSNGSSKG
jgi:hypothetical protein